MFNLEELIVIIVRLLGALPVLKYAFIGSVLAVLIDLSDLFIISNLDLGGVKNYQNLDKFLDLIYMFTFLVVSFRWTKKEKYISIFLFLFRIIGFIIFEITGSREVLLFFPNIFEFWFIFISFLKLKNRNVQIKNKTILYVLIISFAFKILQEWVLHWNKFLDNYAMGDIFSVIKDIFIFL